MGGEVVELAGLEAESFGKEADLDLGGSVGLLAEETEDPAPVKRRHVTNDRGVLGQLGNLAGIGIGVVEVAGGVNQL